MQMEHDETRWKLIRSLRGQSECFVNAAPNGKYSFFKKLGKKLTYWYVYPFGEAQNRFNESASSLIEQLCEDVSSLAERLVELESQTERRFVTFTREQRQILERSENEQQAALTSMQNEMAENDEKQRKRLSLFEESQRKTLTITRTEQMRAIDGIAQQLQSHRSEMQAFAEDVDRSLCAAAPDTRRDAGRPAMLRISGVPASALSEQLRRLDVAADAVSAENALDQLDVAYSRLLRESVENEVNTGSIVFVCREYTGGAAQRELRELFSLMKKNSRLRTVIVSVEADGAPEMMQGDVFRVPESGLSTWMRLHDPALLIFCEANPALLCAGEQCMMLRDSIVRLSGQNPGEQIGGSRMQELLHLSDFGVQHYLTATSAAADAFEALGFRRPAVTAPYIDLNDPALYRKPHQYDSSMFTVGYVDDTRDAETLSLFIETVKANPDMDFLLLTEGGCPEELAALSNCDCCTDQHEKREFYSEIDCILIPYAGRAQMPAVPFSALDGMVMGIPAVCTPLAGISELIAGTGIGAVAADTTPAALSEALRSVRTGYAAYREGWQIAKLRELISGRAFVRFAEECAAKHIPYGMITLYEWDRAVKQEQSHLVHGAAAVRAWFQRRTLPEPSMRYPEAAVDLMERRSAETLIQHYFGCTNRPLSILTVGGEDEKMLSMLLQYGACTFADASKAVNAQREAVYAGQDVQIVQTDILSGDLNGQYDVIAVFRLIRHCEYRIRKQIWARLAAALLPEGIVLADIPNLMHLVPYHQQYGWGKQAVYEVGWTLDRIAGELRENGLTLEAAIPVGQGLYPLSSPYEKEPVSWTAVIKKAVESQEQMYD